MSSLMLFIRNRFHPLFHLRKFTIFQRATRLLDVPIAIRFKNVVHPVYVSLSKNLGWVLSGGESGEEAERQNFMWLVKVGGFQRFIDVGANVGLYGFIFGSVAKDGAVTMIEPDPSNAMLIRKTISASKLHVTLLEAAATSQSGAMTFYKDDLTGSTGSLLRSADQSFISVHHHQNPSEMSVRSITLDELCLLDSPDFLKIDVEGGEMNVFRGGEVMLSRSHPALMFECDQSRDIVRVFLDRLGYAFFDMESLEATYDIPHNCLALHSVKHAAIIDAIADRDGASKRTVAN